MHLAADQLFELLHSKAVLVGESVQPTGNQTEAVLGPIREPCKGCSLALRADVCSLGAAVHRMCTAA